jgi:hypothetical protein
MHKLFTEPPSDYLNLIEWIKENTDDRGRISLEMGLIPHEMFNKPSFINGLISLKTNRQIVGGPHRFPFFKHDFPALTKDEIFKKEWNVSDEDLLDYLNLYNIGWIIVRSQELKNNLDKRKGLFKKSTKINNFKIYEVDTNLSFIIGGTGDVIADFNKIKIKNLKAQEKDIILRYHWHPTLKAKPEFKLEPVFISDGPIPFIKVLEVNTSEFEIYNSYKK